MNEHDAQIIKPQIPVKVKRLHPDAVIPKYAHEGDAGFDLVAVEDVIVEPGETVKVPTGLAFELPPGYEMQIRPRSGITLKTKLRVQLGTVDASYRGEINVIVDNFDYDAGPYDDELIDITGNILRASDYFNVWDEFAIGSYLIRKGDRIAQAVINAVPHAIITEVNELSESERGTGGFGSTGVSAHIMSTDPWGKGDEIYEEDDANA